MVLTLISYSPRGPGLLAPVIGAMRSIVANLTPASGRQDHTTSPSAPAPLVLRHHPRPSHPAPTFVTTRTPLLSRRDSASRKFDLPDGESEIFFAAGLDRKKSRATQLIARRANQLEGRHDKTQNYRRYRVCWRIEVRNSFGRFDVWTVPHPAPLNSILTRHG
jgi:hypothetical protein